MGRYVDQAAIVEAVGEDELLQVAGTGAWNTPEGRRVDVTAVERAIAYVDDLISGYVLARHPWLRDVTAPGDMPELLSGLALDLVRWRLRNQSGTSGQITETVDERHKAAMAMLRDLASGKLDLVDARAGTPEAVMPQTDSVRIDTAPLTASPLADEFLR